MRSTESETIVVAQEDQKWQSFYENRARPCPFFGALPDESLAEWVDQGVVRPGRTLDLGCGNGRNAVFLARRGFSVEGVDYSESAIAWARERVTQADVGVTLTHRSVFDLAVAAGTYDLVYDAGLFHHVPPHRRDQYIAFVVNALKPGGCFGLACFGPQGGSGYSDQDVYERRSMGGGLGYTEEQLREFWSKSMRIHVVRPMHEQGPHSSVFGRSFLWALLARKA